MIEITKQEITVLAPNTTALKNGMKISQSGGFVKLMKSSDETLYMGECKGSGKKNYFTSADYINPSKPVFRCSCPSRQFPCKHSVALLFEIFEKKEFEESEIPEDIIKKRKKIQAQSKKEEVDIDSLSEEEKEKLRKKIEKAKKASNTIRLKKAKAQLEGLEIVEKFVTNMISSGLSSVSNSPLDSYKEISKQLGNYYLLGPQKILNKIIYEINLFKKDNNEAHFNEMIELVKKLWIIIKKSKEYLTSKIERNDMSFDDNPMYEELGNVWKLTELKEAGCTLEDGDYTQLAFYVTKDEGYMEHVDNGVYVYNKTGQIYISRNIRPFKLRKNIKEEDSVFGVIEAKDVVYYPGDGNKRIRWDGFSIRELKDEDYEKIMSHAGESIGDVIKEVKNVLKNPLSDNMYLKLVKFKHFGKTKEDQLVLVDNKEEKLLLSDMEGMDMSCNVVELIPSNDYVHDQVVLLGFFENKKEHRIEAQPISIVTNDRIVRLLY